MTGARKRRRAAVIVVATSFAFANRAGANPVPCDVDRDAVWQPQAVRWPVAPDAVEPVAPWVAASAAEHTDPVEVTASRAAALWIPAVTVKRVRVVRGELADLQLSRVAGSLGARVIAEEVGRFSSGAADLVEPVGPGSMWVIAARVPTTIVVERVERREPRLAWETAHDALHAWIAGPQHGGALPELPTDDGGAAAIRLLGARALLAIDQPIVLRSAIQLWRRTQADAIIAMLRPGNDPYVVHDTHVPDGPVTVDEDEASYGPSPAAGRGWRLELTGPGVLVVDARATAAEAAAGGLAEIDVRRDGAVVVRVQDAVTPTTMLEPGAALPGPEPGVPASTDGVLGRNIRAMVTLALGTHVYDVRVSGAGLVRADVRRRHRRLRESLFDRPQREAERLRAKLASIADPTARSIGESLIAAALGRWPMSKRSAATPAALLVQLVAMPGQIDPELARSLVTTVTAMARHAYGDLERAIILELAERMPDGVDATPLVEALLAPGRSPLPPALLAALAPHLGGGGRSDGLAAAELAWRQHPTAPALRAALFSIARRTALRRVVPEVADTTRTAAARWLTGAAITPAPFLAREFQGATACVPGQGFSGDTAVPMKECGGSAIAELAIGRDTEIDIAPHPDEPERLAVVRVYVATPPEAPGPVRVAFDGSSQSLIALRSLEVVEVAASAGRHTVRVDAPATTRIYVAAPRRSVNEAGAAAVVQRWPVDKTVAYTLPTPRAIGPVRIELLGFPASGPRRHVVWLHSELGPPRRLVLDVRAPDSTSWSLDDDQTPAPPAAIWLWLPRSMRTFWLTTDDGPLYARVSVHGPAAVVVAAAPANPIPPLPRAVDLERVAELSASIATHADAAPYYVARAQALLDLGEVGAARRDLAAAAPHVRSEDRRAFDDARALLDTVADPAYLPVQPPGGPIRSGIVIGSPLIPHQPDLVGLARRIRRDGAPATWAAVERGEIQIAPGAGGQHMAAMLAHRAGQSRIAADRWLDIGSWQARVAALTELRALLEAKITTVAPLALGIATELEDVVVPAVKRARALAAKASRWEPVRHTTHNAGFESMSTTISQLDESPALALRRALLAAPWRDAPAILEPGRASTLSIDGPRTIGVQLWCRRLWPADSPSECRLTSILDQAAPRTVAVPHGQVHSFSVDVPVGQHEIEVGLALDDPTAVAAVRFTDGSAPSLAAIPVVRPARVFLADTGRPAEVVVSGPGAVGVEVRGYVGHPDTADIVVIGPDGERRIAVVVDQAAAPETSAAPSRDVWVTQSAARTVLLAASGTYTIRVMPPRGTVAVRFATRVATEPEPEFVFDRQPELSGDGLPWPVIVPEPTLVAGRDVNSRWIPSVEGVVGQDSLAALDSDFAELDLRFELAAQLRQRQRDRSWFAELRGRRAGPLGPTVRLRAAGEFRRLPLGFAASIDARAAVQTSSAGTLWLARAAGDVARPLLLSPQWQLTPQVALYAAAFGPAAVPYGADPMVASSYRRDRPMQLVESVELTGRPWADQFLGVGFNLRSNDSPVTIDAFGASVMWRGLVETSPRRGGIVMLEYAPTLRLANNHRAYTFLRHDLAAELMWPWSLARGRYGRIAISLRGDLYPPTNISQMAHAVTLKLRWDGWYPGERNRMPSEEPLSDFIDEVSWAGRR